MKDLLPLMMMNGQNGQQMDPMTMMMLMGDGDSSSMKDLLPLMMMNGQNGQQMDPMMMKRLGGGNMDPMTTLMMLDGGSMDDLLPLMMMGGQNGQQGQMNPMMMMSLLGDDTATKKSCDADYKIKEFFTAGVDALESSSDIADIRAGIEGLAVKTDSQQAYVDCLAAATEEGTEKSSMEKLLPMMMMGGGQQMNPMLMMSLLGDG